MMNSYGKSNVNQAPLSSYGGILRYQGPAPRRY